MKDYPLVLPGLTIGLLGGSFDPPHQGHIHISKTAIKIFPQAPLNKDSWKIWTNQVSEKTGRKGKSLFLPLRKALTGKSIGPDMGKLLPFLKKIPEL